MSLKVFCPWQWLNLFDCMAYRLCPRVVFPSKKVFVEEVLLALVEKVLVTYVQLALASCMSATCTFDLWMSIGTHDMFVVIANFIFNKWESKHVTIGLFEAIATNGVAMAPKLWELLDTFSFTNNILTYVKDEGANLQFCATTFTFVVLCKTLGMLELFHGSCFGHALSKVYKYVTTNEKVA